MSKRKPNGYWKDIDNIKKEINFIKIKHTLDSIPTKNELLKLGYKNVAYGIHRNVGFTKLRILFNEELLLKPNNYYKNIDNIIIICSSPICFLNSLNPL